MKNMSATMKFYVDNATSVKQYDECVAWYFYGRAHHSMIKAMLNSDNWDSQKKELQGNDFVIVATCVEDEREYSFSYNCDKKMLSFYYAEAK